MKYLKYFESEDLHTMDRKVVDKVSSSRKINFTKGDILTIIKIINTNVESTNHYSIKFENSKHDALYYWKDQSPGDHVNFDRSTLIIDRPLNSKSNFKKFKLVKHEDDWFIFQNILSEQQRFMRPPLYAIDGWDGLERLFKK